MPIAPPDFLQVAIDLKAGKTLDPREPRDRTIVGRAYYAAFLAARDAVRVAYNDPKYRPKHARLVNGLAASNDPVVAQLGLRLQTLKGLRHRADYDIHLSVSAIDAALMCATAAAVIKDAPKIVPNVPAGL